MTLTVADWPGLMTTGEKVVAGLMAASSRSPVDEVTAESNALAVALIDMLTVPAGAPLGYGPTLGRRSEPEAVVKRPAGVVKRADGDVPMLLTRSGSPWFGP